MLLIDVRSTVSHNIRTSLFVAEGQYLLYQIVILYPIIALKRGYAGNSVLVLRGCRCKNTTYSLIC